MVRNELFANSSLRTISCQFFQQTQKMFAAQWVPCSSEFLFSSIFVGRSSYLTNNFHVTAGAVGSSFTTGSREVRGKINFPNMFANTMFAGGVCECIRSLTIFKEIYSIIGKVKYDLSTVVSSMLLGDRHMAH